jgi:hypothetical protein
MKGEYNCPYILYSGKTCGRACIRPEGCRFHWKIEKRTLCSECDKPTISASGRCPLHIRGYYVSQYYYKHRPLANNKKVIIKISLLVYPLFTLKKPNKKLGQINQTKNRIVKSNQKLE